VGRESLEVLDLVEVASKIKNYIDTGDDQGIQDIKDLFFGDEDFSEFINYLKDQDFILEDFL